MVLEEYVVFVRGHSGNNQRKFTYLVDPHKKPNIKSVLKDFKHDAQIHNIDEWKLCTLAGTEIRFLADYADRILVLTPIQISSSSTTPKLPSIRTTSNNRSVTLTMSSIRSDNNNLLSKSSSSTLPSLYSTTSSSVSGGGGEGLLNEYHNGNNTTIPVRLKRSRSLDNNIIRGRKPPHRRRSRTMVKSKEK